ncbi:hypothetical protein EMPS_01109 [Entomortierella parvispora]|uniref:Uncharacterized protein n=1 Tax=Entomortierella parvispora TaxID=205924 RepID=A0A9P3H280_9FUNG|nr:hypothetical protein EMPS_01109 [Entomortierella parvispora]
MPTTLFNSSDISLWESILDQYPDALSHHVASKKDNSLLKLDEWYQTTLPAVLATRSPVYMTSKELCQLMSWKLKRGKFRPNLLKLAESNSDADVKRVSEEAFKLIPTGLRAAITKMAELKGVGPATASAILCSGAPSEVPFMADETMASVPGLGPIAYTIPYYIRFAAKVIEKAKELEERGSAKVTSPHLVEMALWSEYILDKYSVPRKVQSSPIKNSQEAPNKVTPDTQKQMKSKAVGSKRQAEPTSNDCAPEKRAKTITPTQSRTTRRA